jgi:RNA polymerase sigma-32 factor
MTEKRSLVELMERKPVPRRNIAKGASACLNPLQIYMHEINQFRLLSREEEINLAVRYKENRDKEAGQELVTSNLRLVIKIALDFQRHWTKELLDLIQEGNLGLVQAVNKFDPYRGIKFSYYAAFWIKAYILKFLLDNWRLVKIGTTQNQRKLFFRLRKEKDELIKKGIHPEPRLLAERLAVREQDIIEMSQRLQTPELSINAFAGNQSGNNFAPQTPDPGIHIDERLSRAQRKDTLLEKVNLFRRTLSEREADILDNRIMAEKPMTLQMIGEKYQISRERVRQIQTKMIRKITTWLTREIPNFHQEYADMVG